MERTHGTGYGIYLVVWGGLLFLTAATVAVSYLDLGLLNVAAALAIASAKAALVALFFMHLKFESKLVWTFALVPIFFLALIIGGTLSDTLFR
ncbi:MAG: cytochrome C oxidase subunit IV family protein [Candidatus Deferrimicrobiota bacterium]